MKLSQHQVFHLDLGMEYRGGQRQVIYLAQEQVRAGLNVRLLSPHGAPILYQATQVGVPIAELPGRYDFDPRNIMALRRIAGPGTIIHTHDARSASLGALACKQGSCLIHTRRVSYPLGSGWSRWKYQRGHCVVCVSREVEAQVRQAGIEHTTVVPSTLILDRYPLQKQNRRDYKRIGIIGALSPQKGHVQFLRALSCLKTKPEVWIVGSGELESELRTLAKELNLEDHIFWKGYVESTEVLSCFDILIVPSAHGEGSSGVIKEGWASKVPVICSDLVANKELITDEINGLIFRNGDYQHLATQIECLMNNPELGKKLADQGYKDVQQYTSLSMYEKYNNIYTKYILH